MHLPLIQLYPFTHVPTILHIHSQSSHISQLHNFPLSSRYLRFTHLGLLSISPLPFPGFVFHYMHLCTEVSISCLCFPIPLYLCLRRLPTRISNFYHGWVNVLTLCTLYCVPLGLYVYSVCFMVRHMVKLHQLCITKDGWCDYANIYTSVSGNSDATSLVCFQVYPSNSMTTEG